MLVPGRASPSNRRDQPLLRKRPVRRGHGDVRAVDRRRSHARCVRRRRDRRRRWGPVAYLWASEDTIYGRFGYGAASQAAQMTLAVERTRFREPFEGRGTVRLVDLEEAAETFPLLYERTAAVRAGMFSRSDAW